ncbi:MAG: SurA N-terminal domain-containing protein [Gammaproteobacteria bacterium]|jgi:peptidyl-prolyl cis-trans isomerase SurA
MKKYIGIILLLLINSQIFADSTIDRIRATVNDDIITQSELDKRITGAKSQLRAVGVESPEDKALTEQVLNRLIEERLIIQQADLMGVQVDDSALNKALTSIAKNNNTDLNGFREMLEKDGYDYIEFREQIRKDMLINQIQQQRVGYNIVVSEEEVDRLVGELSQKDSPTTQYRVGHILVALPRNPSSEQVQLAQARASDAITALKKSTDFTQVALQYSDSTNVLEQADLGWRTRAQLPSLIADVVPNMQVNEIAKPIRNNSGFHVIQLLEKREQVLQSAQKDAQRQQAKEYLYQQKLQEAMQAWLTQLRDGAHVDVKT